MTAFPRPAAAVPESVNGFTSPESPDGSKSLGAAAARPSEVSFGASSSMTRIVRSFESAWAADTTAAIKKVTRLSYESGTRLTPRS
ncbi:hypothetical protein CLCR_07821 [Cladophialophora carrionii]|uniref:Uncharacterized protein n=1 Tax=Cladophialophora carrionii TaxID=86049 RepID=A0A1C1CQL9_9EURO|nr:hypothetical protein CLCR_07821 [Cladophialophora carrionii]